MLFDLLQMYFAVALIFAISAHQKWPLTGSKQDYAVMEDAIETGGAGRGWKLFCRGFMIVAIGIIWPRWLYLRTKDWIGGNRL